MAVTVSVLGSGSRGNTTFIKTPTTRILIDAGLSRREIAKRLTAIGRRAPGTIAGVAAIVEEYSTPRQTQLLVRTDGLLSDPNWEVADVSLEEIVLAYLGQSDGAQSAREADAAELEVFQ